MMLEFAKQIALEAGELLKKYYYADSLVIENKAAKDLVTEADKACEKFLVEKILEKYPNHVILGEEGSGHELWDKKTNTHKWIIDPIDGTTNFAHHLPVFGISIGIELEGEIIYGVIYNPINGEFFYGEKDRGAYMERLGSGLEPKKLQVSNTAEFSRALLATGFHPGHPEMFNEKIEMFKKMMQKSHTVRRLGAACIDLAYVAAGYFEGHWEHKLKPWDVAAGILLIREAGGTVTNIDGTEYSIYGEQILASNGLVHQEMLKQLNN